MMVDKNASFCHSALLETYNKFFNTIPADTPELVREAFKLRYKVYCQENNFEKPDSSLEECETDEFDSRSVHSLLVNRRTGTFVGTVRIILPRSSEPFTSFPIQKICRRTISHEHSPYLMQTAEISRLALSKECRKKEEKTHHRCEHSSSLRSMMPFLTLGLIQSIVRMSVENGVSDLFAVMEPAMLRLLARFGIYFRPIGQLVEYHGMRQPCHAVLFLLLERVRKERPDVWAVITDNGSLTPVQAERASFV